MTRPPFYTVIAGPNGAGKSTIAQDLHDGGFPLGPFINPDDIAAGIEGHRAVRDLRAGRETLRQAQARIAARETFSRESTLSSREILRSMQGAKEAGFIVTMVYVGVDHLDISKDRVRHRVARGGHDIPEASQDRRFQRSMDNAALAVQFARTAFFVHNPALIGHRLVGCAVNGHLVHTIDHPPGWFSRVSQTIPPWPRGVISKVPPAFATMNLTTLLKTIERLSRDVQDPSKSFSALRTLGTLRRQSGFPARERQTTKNIDFDR